MPTRIFIFCITLFTFLSSCDKEPIECLRSEDPSENLGVNLFLEFPSIPLGAPFEVTISIINLLEEECTSPSTEEIIILELSQRDSQEDEFEIIHTEEHSIPPIASQDEYKIVRSILLTEPGDYQFKARLEE